MIIIGYQTANEISHSAAMMGSLFQDIIIFVGYHESERQWLDTARSMKRWLIITTIQCYGHVAQDPRNAGPWSQVPVCHGHLAQTHTRCREIIVNYLYWWYEIASLGLDGHVARDPHNAGIQLEVTVPIVWNGKLRIGWSCSSRPTQCWRIIGSYRTDIMKWRAQY